MSKLKQDLIDNKIPLIAITIYCVFMQLVFGAMCPFKVFFHIDCPGCGMTRATISLLKGDISKSFHYNYACIFWLIAIVLFIIDRYIKPLKIKPFPLFFVIAAVITIIRYILIVLFNEPIF